MKKNLLYIVFILALFSCARVGAPDGGPKDITPPKVVASYPDSMMRNVSTSLKELRIDFDEYVTLKDPTKQLIISPPLKNIKKIIPSQMANKYILIQWSDTLQANTTYNFNFGNSIADNNEGNILHYYNFVFSTGDKIDSLYVSGYIDDVLQPRIKDASGTTTSTNSDTKDKPIVVGLYKADSKTFAEKPYYIAPVDADGYFELNYLAAGDYKMIAFQDENLNSMYDSGKEKIAFMSEPLHLDKDIIGIRMSLSPPKKKFKFNETKSIPGGLMMLFSGHPKTDSLNLKMLGETLQSFTITKKPKSDSAFVWINPKENKFAETTTPLKFSFYNSVKKKVDSTATYYKVNAKDELTISNQSGNELPPHSTLRIRANMELKNIDVSKWEMKMDSTTVVPFTAKISDKNPFEILVNSDFDASKKFTLSVPKETVEAYYFSNQKKNIFNFETGKAENYGSLQFDLVNAPTAPFWIQLLDSKFDVVIEEKLEGKTQAIFKNIKPDTYSIRILVDNNNNGEWDGADFEKQIQPEEAYLYKKKITVRQSFDLRENWDLKDTTPYDASKDQDSFIPTGTDIKKIDTTPKKKPVQNPNHRDPNNPNNNLLNQQNPNNPFQR